MNLDATLTPNSLGLLVLPVVRRAPPGPQDVAQLEQALLETYRRKFGGVPPAVNCLHPSSGSNPPVCPDPRKCPLSQTNPHRTFGPARRILKRKVLKKVNMDMIGDRKIVFRHSNVRFVFEITAVVDK